MTKRSPIRLGLVIIDSPRWMGGGIYLRNLVYALASLPADEKPEVRLIGISDPKSPLVEDLCSFDFVCKPGFEPGLRGRRSSWSARLQGWLLGRQDGRKTGGDADRLDLVYPAGFGVDVLGATRLYWIADFQHVHLPHLFSPAEIRARQRGMARIARQDAVLVLSSQSALEDFRVLFPNARIRPRVWSFCSSFGPAETGGADPGPAYGLPEKFLYLPNQFWAHKDHLTAFKALAILKADGIVPTVVCTGLEEDYRNPDHFRMLMEYLKRERLEDQVRCLGLVPRQDQVQIFRHSSAVLQPSLFEGWSTVVEDAKGLGRPLILSDIPPHREQAERNACFFKAGSAEELARVLGDLWPRLSPGPDAAAERAALARAAERRLELARAFMAIVDEALAVGHSV